MEDRKLLQRYVQDHSQEAFAALTARYVNLVYAVCRRELDNADAAEDVTQAVFLILARKAPTLGRNVVLSGWLFQTARFTARNARLTAQRRASYERKAAEALMDQQAQTENKQWAEIEPLLNQSLAALKAADRNCILLRFFQGQSFAEVGASLGVSEDAARKRVTRALDKMRQVFTKNGVIVPAVALPVLLAAHAAKAAPTGLASAAARSSPGIPAYQLSEGTLQAMKITRFKLAAGITAAAVLGISTYAVARSIVSAHSQPGHVLQQVPGETITAAQIADRCRAAYHALQSYQVTATVDTHYLTVADGQSSASHTSATIQFVRPGKIHAEGTDLNGHSFAYVSDGAVTEETTHTIGGTWRLDRNTEMAVASVGGIAAGAATTIPALLLDTSTGIPTALGSSDKLLDPEVREDAVQGHPCYVLTSHSVSTARSETQSLWIDEKTFLLRRSVSDFEHADFTFFIKGKPQTIPASKSHDEENFTNERTNQPIPDSTFTLPPVQ